MTIRYISQNPQMIPYSQDMQNQPVYCPNGQIMQPDQQVNQQNHIQQYTQQTPQNYAQPAYYYIPGNLPQHMQTGPITYVSHGS